MVSVIIGSLIGIGLVFLEKPKEICNKVLIVVDAISYKRRGDFL